MRLHGNISGRAHRSALGLVPAAALAVTLAACSSSASTAPPTTKHQATTPAAVAQATSAPASAPAASALSGTWHGQYSGSYQGTFVLHWNQAASKLSGHIHISNPASTMLIHGSVAGGSIRFGTVGSYAITYSGTVSGGSMSGTYHVANGNAGGGPWSASKG
jgi:hypothetical protein